jgi:creatinine amidohydrolase
MVGFDISGGKTGGVSVAARSLLFAELTRQDLRSLAPDALVVVPLGATEQHGPHLPTGTDFFHAEWVAREGARQAAASIQVVVTPTLPFGSSEHHFPFGGTISLSTTSYYDAVTGIVESLARDGFRRMFLVNGHGGNHELIQLVARDVALRLPVAIVASSWWLAGWDVMVAAGALAVGRLPGHAGGFETSLVMAMRPELVDGAALPTRSPTPTPDGTRWPGLTREERHGFWQSIDGYSDGPGLASAEQGQRFLDASAAELARLFVAFHGTPLPEG